MHSLISSSNSVPAADLVSSGANIWLNWSNMPRALVDVPVAVLPLAIWRWLVRGINAEAPPTSNAAAAHASDVAVFISAIRMYSSFRVWNTTPPSTIPSYSTVCMHDVLWPRPVDRTMTRRLQVDVNFADLADSAATSQGQEPAKPRCQSRCCRR